MQKVCLITGAAGGIGLGLAQAFVDAGFAVVLADIDLVKAQAAADNVSGETLAVEMDVTSEASVTHTFSQVIEKYGRLDVLINNAGLQIISALEDFDCEKFTLVNDVILKGGFLLSKHAMKIMKPQKSGSILFIGSVHAAVASRNKSAYVAAKHGLLGLMRAVAEEGAEFNIRSNMVSPGFVKTPLVDKQIPEQAQALGISEEDVVKKVMLGNTIDGEFTTIDDVARSCLFFATFPTSALTGQSLLLTHGWCMQ